MKDLTIGFIGLGLIGGSIARGIKRSRRDMRIMAKNGLCTWHCTKNLLKPGP